MGPPGGPENAWEVYNNTLYINFFPQIRSRFFEDADKNIALANARWTGWWGDLNSGPMNTHCLAETWHDPGGNCMKDPQPIPPEN